MANAVGRLSHFGLLSVLLAGLVSGCLGGGNGDASDAGPPGQTTSAGLGTGVVEGVVTSDLFEPLANATVNVIQLRLTAAAAGGEYRFEGLPPGLFTFVALAPGYEEQVKSVQVEENTTLKHDFRLTPLPRTDPYIETYEVAGFVSLSAKWDVAPGGECFSGLAGAPFVGGFTKTCGGVRFGNTCVVAGACAGEPTLNGEIAINVSHNVGTLIVELVWVPKGPLGENLVLDVLAPCTVRGSGGSVTNPDTDPCYFDNENTTSPLHIRVDNTTLIERGIDLENRTGDWAARVFSGSGMLGTWETADVGVAWQQDFRYYVTMAYNSHAPAEHSGLPDT